MGKKLDSAREVLVEYDKLVDQLRARIRTLELALDVAIGTLEAIANG